MNYDESFYKEREYGNFAKTRETHFLKDAGTVTAANSCGINDGAAAV